jgi:hypothetical protein
MDYSLKTDFKKIWNRKPSSRELKAFKIQTYDVYKQKIEINKKNKLYVINALSMTYNFFNSYESFLQQTLFYVDEYTYKRENKPDSYLYTHQLAYAQEFASDEDIIELIIEKQPLAFIHLGMIAKSNYDLVLKVYTITKSNKILYSIEPEMFNSKIFLMKLILINPSAYNLAPPELIDDCDILHMVIYANPKVIFSNKVSVSVPDDLFIICIRDDGMLLAYGSSDQKSNKTIVQIAIEQNPKSFIYASDILKKDQDLLLILIQKLFETIERNEEKIEELTDKQCNCY